MKFIGFVLLMYCSQLLKGQVVINEILFNPARDGYDYVELYNTGNDEVDLNNFMIGNRNSTGDIASVKQVSKNALLLRSHSFAVVTSNEKWVRQNYQVSNEAVMCQVSGLASFPDDEGSVILLKEDSSIVDELMYEDKWHFALLSEVSGVALERINYSGKTQDANNWTSASAASGHGTPGSQNSQFKTDIFAGGNISLLPKVFSPDNDGRNDVALLTITMNEPGFVANSIIYDAAGRRIKYLLKNQALGVRDQFKWDGSDDNSLMSPRGIYIVFTQVFNLTGYTKKYKNVIVLQ